MRFLGLPWNLVICEDYDDQVFSELQAADSSDELMERRRGLVQILDRDPSRVELPQRCLPIFLLNGREPKKNQSGFEEPTAYYRLFRLITKGVPSADVVMLNATVHPSCYPMDLPMIQRQTDAEGLDYFEVPITFTEIGDD